MGQATQSRSKKRILALSAGLITLALGSGATLVAVGGPGPGALGRGLDVLAMLQQRSPGARTSAQLTKIKHALPSLAAPGDRALGTDFSPPAVNEAIGPLGLASPEQLLAPPATPAFAPGPGAGELPSAILTPTFVGGGGGGGFIGGGGGGGGGGGNVPTPTGETPPPTPPPPQSAVPEPGTWATMLVGMALCGFGLRRRRKPRSGSVRSLCPAA